MGVLCINCCEKQKGEDIQFLSRENTDREFKPKHHHTAGVKQFDYKRQNSDDYLVPRKSARQFSIKQKIETDISIQAQIFINENSSSPAEKYEYIEEIGQGGFATVFRVKHKASEEYRAMKVIKRGSLIDNVSFKNLFDEINILKKLDHPHIIKIYEFFQDMRNLYLITEYIEHGDLFKNLLEYKDEEFNPFFTEEVSKEIMKQLLQAINYLHSENIIHGDIKLENILMNTSCEEIQQKKKEIDIKVIDFGCSQFFRKNNLSPDTINGTINYVAPEAIKGVIIKKNDIWSCGVIFYILLSGIFPFEGRSDTQTIENIEKSWIDFSAPVFKKISPTAKDLLCLLLEPNPDERIDAKQALKHVWFKNGQQTKEININYQKEIMNNLKNFKAERKFQQAVYTYIAHNLVAKEEIEGLRTIFQNLDDDGNGRITKEELQKGFKDSVGYILGEIELQTLMKNMDHDNSGYIEYEEFLQAALGSKTLLTNKNLLQTFKSFDLDGSGEITEEELRKVIGGDKGINDENFKEFLAEIDLNSGDTLTFEKFRGLMRGLKRRNTSYK